MINFGVRLIHNLPCAHNFQIFRFKTLLLNVQENDYQPTAAKFCILGDDSSMIPRKFLRKSFVFVKIGLSLLRTVASA